MCVKDNCTQQLTNTINNARTSVHCALYDLDAKEIIQTLGEKSKTVDVKVVIDKDNFLENFKGPGVRYDTRRELMHNKFCIIDDRLVWTGSFNPTKNGDKNANNALVIHSTYLAQNFENEFAELWNGTFGGGEAVTYPLVNYTGGSIESYFCPEDQCQIHVLKQILNAQQSIHMMIFSFTDEKIADALLYKDDITIQGVFDSSQAGGAYSQVKRLQEFGLDIRKDLIPHKLHHKVFIIDKKTVITGSYNPTLAGTLKNDENMLIIHDSLVASLYLNEFQRIWNYEKN